MNLWASFSIQKNSLDKVFGSEWKTLHKCLSYICRWLRRVHNERTIPLQSNTIWPSANKKSVMIQFCLPFYKTCQENKKLNRNSLKSLMKHKSMRFVSANHLRGTFDYAVKNGSNVSFSDWNTGGKKWICSKFALSKFKQIWYEDIPN